jgi:hypothetical protein
LLYGSLVNCEEAFTQYKQAPSEINLANAVFAIDSFISTLYNLDAILSLFEPDLKNKLEKYALEESRIAYLSKPKELLKAQVELLHNVVKTRGEITPLLAGDLSAFTGARKKLARFISATFSPNELFEET